MKDRQKADNKARFKAMVVQVRQVAEDYMMQKGVLPPMPFHVVAKAIRDADARTMDDRTACRWVLLMVAPPRSLWTDGPILEPVGPVQLGLNGKPKPRAVMRNSYRVVKPMVVQVNIDPQGVVLCR